MLIDDNNPQTTQPKTVLDKLAASPYTFYLTGSRFFGTNRPTSDWDYFVQIPTSDGHKLFDELRSFGFTKRYNSDYLDFNTVGVWSYDTVDVQVVDVQVVADASIKRASQTAFMACGILFPKEKDWNAACRYWDATLNREERDSSWRRA